MRLNLTLTAVLAAVLFLGAGCVQTADELATDAVKPVAVPIAALNQAKQVTGDVQAQANWQAELIANEMTVAMVLTEGNEPPAGLTVESELFGCNDHIVFVKTARESETDNPLRDALNSLFAIRETTFKELHNSLANSSLAVDKIQSTDGVTTEVWLTGQTQSAGECDDPRIKEQVAATVRRLKPHFRIFFNGSEKDWRCLTDLSGQCE